MKKIFTLSLVLCCCLLMINQTALAQGGDNCATAMALVANAADCDGVLTNGDQTGATDSGDASGTCFNGGNNGDVWFSVVVPTPATDLVVSTDFAGGTLTDSEIAVYNGACGSLVEVGCDQDAGTVVNFNSVVIIAAADLIEGETLLIQVDRWGTAAAGTFCIQADFVVFGCNDPTACNFDAAATVDDGSCILPGMVCDDLDDCTENDVLQADCVTCAGTPVTFACPVNPGYVPCVDCATGTTFADAGGTAAGYVADELTTTIICPGAGMPLVGPVSVTFTYVDIEVSAGGCFDGFLVYDGADATAPPLPALGGLWCGEASGDLMMAGSGANNLALGTVFTSTDPSGCVTFVFEADGSVQETGWIADVDCGACMIPTAGTWGLILLTLSLLSIGLIMIERKEEELATA